MNSKRLFAIWDRFEFQLFMLPNRIFLLSPPLLILFHVHEIIFHIIWCSRRFLEKVMTKNTALTEAYDTGMTHFQHYKTWNFAYSLTLKKKSFEGYGYHGDQYLFHSTVTCLGRSRIGQFGFLLWWISRHCQLHMGII